MTTTITPESTTIKQIVIDTQKEIAKVIFLQYPKYEYTYTGFTDDAAQEILDTHATGESMGRAFAKYIKPLPYTKALA